MSSTKPEVHNIIAMTPKEDRATAIRNMHKKLVKITVWFWGYLAVTQTHAHRRTHYNTSQPLPRAKRYFADTQTQTQTETYSSQYFATAPAGEVNMIQTNCKSNSV